MKKFLFVSLLSLLYACEGDKLQNEKEHSQAVSEKKQRASRITVNSVRGSDVERFNNSIKEFNVNVGKYGQERAEEILKQEAIEYLRVNKLQCSEEELTSDLVIRSLNDISLKVKIHLKK